MLWWNLEALSRLVERAVKGAMFQEFQEEVKRGVSLSFPPLFCWWLTCLLMAQMWAYLRCVLLCFEAVSKLSVNLDKSELLENSFLKMFIPLKKAIKCPWGLAQVVKGWRGFVGGYRFKSQWGPKIYLSKKNKKQKKGNQVTLIKNPIKSELMERESEDDEGGFREEKRGRKKRKEGRFGVESKLFEIGVE